MAGFSSFKWSSFQGGGHTLGSLRGYGKSPDFLVFSGPVFREEVKKRGGSTPINYLWMLIMPRSILMRTASPNRCSII